MSSEDIPEQHMGPFEQLANDGYALRLLEHLLIHREFTYKEGELAECSSVPQDKLDRAIRVLDEYRFLDVSGDAPKRKFKLNYKDKDAAAALHNLDVFQFYLSKRNGDVNSIKGGYDDKQKLV